MLESFQKAGRREAGPLAAQMKIAGHCSAIATGKLQKMPRHELSGHLHALHEEQIPLPFELRCELLVRRCNDLVLDLTAASPETITKATQGVAQVLSFWSQPDSECNDSKLQFNNVWAVVVSSIKALVRTGELSPNEQEDEEIKMAQVLCWGSG